jgi:hypothetical protein
MNIVNYNAHDDVISLAFSLKLANDVIALV